MEDCATCGRPLGPGDPRPTLRSDGSAFHLSCAPSELVDRASEEYRAIVRKGVRYFVEKYAGTLPTSADASVRFLELGRAIEAERARRSPG